MESSNLWRFVRSTPFQMLIDRPEFKDAITRYFNHSMRRSLEQNNIYNISFIMNDIQRSATGYYFKFTLDYIDPVSGTFSIFRVDENLHISFHQRTNAANQTHISITKNGNSRLIPITFSNAHGLNVHIEEHSIRDSLTSIGIIPYNLFLQFRIGPAASEQLFENIVMALYHLTNVLPSIFSTMDVLSQNLGYGELILYQETPGRQASRLAGGNNKYIKYKFNFLYL